MFSLNKWTGITESEWVTYHAPNDQARLQFLLDRIPKLSKVMEVGCGCGFQAGTIMKEKQPEVYLGFDPNPEKVASCVEMAFLNAEQIYFTMRHFFGGNICVPIEPRFFVDRFEIDTILCTEVLEHVPNPEYAIERLCSLLREGAKLLITVPAQDKLLDVPGHINNFCPLELSDEFRKYVEVDNVETIVDTYTFIEAHK